MVELSEIVKFCNERVGTDSITDFPGAHNGLQLENNGKISKIGAAVDAGKVPFEQAIRAGIDFLIVHHGLYWSPIIPLTGHKLSKLKICLEGNLSVYSSHLPLDAHPEIGNNAIIAEKLGLPVVGHFCKFEGTEIATIAENNGNRASLAEHLRGLFPKTFKAIEYGSLSAKRIAILSGSGRSALDEMRALDIDTLITGELRQEHFNLAQEQSFNLYPCGHYATEVFGVQALAAEVAAKFKLPWEFIATDCPL